MPDLPAVARSRRAAVASLPSLAAISAAFFLPFVRGCETMVSPASFVAESWGKWAATVWVVPRFAVAALLGALTLVAILRRRAPGRRSEVAAFLALVPSLCAYAINVWLLSEHRGTAVVAIAGVGGAALAAAAIRGSSWVRWERLIAAHAMLSAPLLIVVGDALRDPGGTANVGGGAWLYATALCLQMAFYVASLRCFARSEPAAAPASR